MRYIFLFQICFLIFAILYIVSYFIITRYKRKSGKQTHANERFDSNAMRSRHVPWPHGTISMVSVFLMPVIAAGSCLILRALKITSRESDYLQGQ